MNQASSAAYTLLQFSTGSGDDACGGGNIFCRCNSTTEKNSSRSSDRADSTRTDNSRYMDNTRSGIPDNQILLRLLQRRPRFERQNVELAQTVVQQPPIQ